MIASALLESAHIVVTGEHDSVRGDAFSSTRSMLPIPVGHAANPRPAGASSEFERDAVPEISRFFGIVITMYYRDHEPPHFHACYGEHEAQIALDTLLVLREQRPRRAAAMFIEWAAIHREELRAYRERARAGVAPLPIPPLE